MKTGNPRNPEAVSMRCKRTLLSLAVASASFSSCLQAAPSGASIVHGSVSIDGSIAGVTNITNSPNAIINWQDFSVNQNEITRFIQQSSQSAVLNRVVGANPSQIMGQLLSNGQVYLINPNGIVFGANSVIDTAGFIASTLNLSNEDFLSGNYHFIAGSDAGDIDNQGIIRAGKDGNIMLIAPNIKNSGIISTEGGQITLAAGEELTVTSLDNPRIAFQLQAPDNDILNIGEILTQGGAAHLFASSITHSGEINANSFAVDEQGEIWLVAKDTTMLTEDSLTSANNTVGEAGDIRILGDKVGLIDQSTVTADGQTGGGEILIGGDYQGANPDIQNATNTTIEENVSLTADANQNGDGGKIIVWSDYTTEVHADISANGGTESGNGGFVEVSGEQHLQMTGLVDLTAINGAFGTLLLDPGAVSIQDGVGTNTGPDSFDDAYIITQLGLGNLTIATSAASAGNETITVNSNTDISWSQATTLTLNSGRNVIVNAGANIENTSSTTGFDAIVINANTAGTTNGQFRAIEVAGDLSTIGGDIRLTGIGGDTSNQNDGVAIYGGANITTSDGAVIITGTGNGSGLASGNDGVTIQGTGTLIDVGAGSLTITGTGGSDGTAIQGSYGIYLDFRPQLVSSSGSITLQGTGDAANAGFNAGIMLNGSDGLISTDSGAIDITGFGGNGAGDSNYGIWANAGFVIEATGAGTITMDGTGGDGVQKNYGLNLDNITISSLSGIVDITGTGGDGSSHFNYGIHLNNSTISSTTGNITFSVTGGSGLQSNYGGLFNANISSVDGNISITASGGAGTEGSNIGFSSGSGYIYTTGIGDITLNATGGGTGLASGFNQGVSLSNSVLFQTVDGDIAITGNGGIGNSTLGSKGVYFTGRAVSTGLGNITLIGNAGAGGSDDGIQISGRGTSTDLASDIWGGLQVANGDISITANGSVVGGIGLTLSNSARVIGTGNSSDIIINASGGDSTGGDGSGSNYGLYMTGNGDAIDINPEAVTLVRANGGNISISGTGGDSATGGQNHGIYMLNAAKIENLGLGTITLTGTGGDGFGNNRGVFIEGNSLLSSVTTVEANGGAIDINGFGGDGVNAGNNYGANLQNDVLISNAGTGIISLDGIAGDLGINNHGVVFIGSGASGFLGVQSANGLISITGQGSASSGWGINLNSNVRVSTTGAGGIEFDGRSANLDGFRSFNAQIGEVSSSGHIKFFYSGVGSDQIDFNSTTIQTSGNVFFSPLSIDNTLGFGGASADYGFSNALISEIETAVNAASIYYGSTDGTGSFILNNNTIFTESTVLLSSTGNMTVNGNLIAAGGVVFNTGGDINFISTNSTTTGNIFLQNGTLLIGNHLTSVPSTLNVTGNFTFRSGSTFAPRVGAGGVEDLLAVTNTLTIDPTAVLEVYSLGGYAGVQSDTFTPITANFISGSFDPDIVEINPLTLPIGAIYPSSSSLLLTMGAGSVFQFNNGSGGVYLWSDPENWGGILPADDSSLTIPPEVGAPIVLFDATAGNVSPTDLTASETLRITGGSLILQDDSGLTHLDIQGGTFGFSGGVLDINGDFSWTGGAFVGGQTLDLTGVNSVMINNVMLDAVTLLTDSSVTNSINNLTIRTGGSLLHSSTVSYDIASGETITVEGGEFRITAGAPILNVDGTLNWSGGSINLLGTTPLGISVNSGGTLNVTGNISLNQLVIDGGTVSGDSNLTLNTSGLLTWNSGAYTGSGIFDTTAATTATVSTATVQAGTVIFDNVTSFNNAILNVQGGTLALQADATLNASNEINLSGNGILRIYGSDVFTNEGGINLSGNGIIEVESGTGILDGTGAFNLIGGTIRGDGTYRLRNATGFFENIEINGVNTTVEFDGDSTLAVNSFDLVNGLVIFYDNEQVDTGDSFTIQDRFESEADLNVAGELILQGGSVTIQESDRVILNGGTLKGDGGSIPGTLEVVSGTLSPGASPGTLTISGDLILGAGATTLLEITGLTQGVQYDFINVAGAVTLGGILNIVTTSYSGESIGDSFDFIQSGSGISGSFSSLLTSTGYAYTPSVLSNIFNLISISLVSSPSAPTGTPEAIAQTADILALTEQSTLQEVDPVPDPVDEGTLQEATNIVSQTGDFSLNTTLVDFIEIDTFPPADNPTSGIPLPDTKTVNLVEALDMLDTVSYTASDEELFFSGLTEIYVVDSLRETGNDRLADFFEATANGESTNEIELFAVLQAEGMTAELQQSQPSRSTADDLTDVNPEILADIDGATADSDTTNEIRFAGKLKDKTTDVDLDEEQKANYLSVFSRMRHIGMTKLLAKALDILKQDPDAADVFDDGETGGPIKIRLTKPEIDTNDGLAAVEGKLESDSKLLYLGVNGNWVFVDPDGKFSAKLPVKAGNSQLDYRARDVGGASAGTKQPVTSTIDGKAPAIEGKRIALFIGVEEYDHAIPELETPLNDAEVVARKMAEDQGFEYRLLENPGKQEILDNLLKLSGELSEHDSLMVYYAGHGYLVEETGRGYWLPRDAETDNPGNWISNRDIARLFHRTPAKQVMLVSDSCYSGSFTKGSKPDNIAENDVRWLRAVMAMSSGGEQPVWDGGSDGHSIFASKMIDTIEKGGIKGLPFYTKIKNKVVEVAPQVPGYGAMMIPGYDQGADFVLK